MPRLRIPPIRVTDGPNGARGPSAASRVWIASLYPGDLFTVGSGTSYAAPFVTGAVALCIATGACVGLTPAQIVAKFVDDARAYLLANPAWGFDGDPLHPITGRHYGPLLRAALY